MGLYSHDLVPCQRPCPQTPSHGTGASTCAFVGDTNIQSTARFPALLCRTQAARHLWEDFCGHPPLAVSEPGAHRASAVARGSLYLPAHYKHSMVPCLQNEGSPSLPLFLRPPHTAEPGVCTHWRSSLTDWSAFFRRAPVRPPSSHLEARAAGCACGLGLCSPPPVCLITTAWCEGPWPQQLTPLQPPGLPHGPVHPLPLQPSLADHRLGAHFNDKTEDTASRNAV